MKNINYINVNAGGQYGEFLNTQQFIEEQKEKIRKICSYHSDEGTSGYLLDESRFADIFALIDFIHHAAIAEGRRQAIEEAIKTIENTEEIDLNLYDQEATHPCISITKEIALAALLALQEKK